MSKISVVMPVYNTEKYVAEAIESVLKQSFSDFEFIIIDDGSDDKTLSIIRSFPDKRIVLLQNQHDFIGSLNLGLQKASGKYIARMDADDIMHIDRLKIQHAVMEEEPSITVCGTWSVFFGENIPARNFAPRNGVIELPVLEQLKGNIVTHPTVMMRTDFLRTHHLQYEHYPSAEDYKLWFEIAKRKGLFYIESQFLLNYRISQTQVTYTKRQEQIATTIQIQTEVLEYLIEQNEQAYPEFKEVYQNLTRLKDLELLGANDVFLIFYTLFNKNKSKLRVC